MIYSKWIQNEDRNEVDMRMNTRSLQDRFSSVYKTFFNTHHLVLSAHGILTWWSDMSHGVSALRIKQKIPLKNYCGVNINNSWKITFWFFENFSILEDTFHRCSVESLYKKNLSKVSIYIKDYLIQAWYIDGIEFDFLCEAPPGHGFCFSSSLTTTLAYTCFLLTKKISIDQLKDGVPDLSDDIFEEIYILSLEISQIISEGKSVGASNYTSMISDTSCPTVHFLWELRPWEPRYHYKDSFLHFLWIPMDPDEDIPLDYWVIFTGLEYRFRETEDTREQQKLEEQSIFSVITERFLSLDIPISEKESLCESIKPYIGKWDYMTIDITNFQILAGLSHLLNNQRWDDASDMCIDIFKKIWLLSFAYQKENMLYCKFQYLFDQYRQFQTENIAIMPFNSGKIWGSFFFVMKKWKSHTTLKKVLEKMNSDGDIALIEYASWRDGVASQGIVIEQYLSEKIYSTYTREWSIMFSDTLWNSYFAEYSSILENEIHGILLDTIGWRIYVQWKKLTSKDIHSQNTTIDMFKILIWNIGNEVSNSELPISTYSQNKNEILSKVVLPIKRIAKQYFDSELLLTCSWWITDYFLRLDKNDDIRIGIIWKI